AIASRFAVDHLLGPTSIQVGEDGIRFVEHCNDLVDLWDFTVGDIAEWGQNAGPSRFFEENHEKPFTGQVKAGNHTNKPVVGVGRVTNRDTMVAIIQSGQFDIIGAARPSISDPFLPKKLEAGRPEDIRECIGCNQCISRWGSGGCVTSCSQLGHSHRKESLFRGTARGLGEWKRTANYRQIQLDKLKNVEVHLNSRLSAKDVLEYGAEIVVIATGCHFATDGLN